MHSKASAASKASDPTDDAAATQPVADRSASTTTSGSPSSLPFTGYAIFPAMLVAVLFLAGGFALRRVSRA